MDRQTVVADLGWCMARLAMDRNGKAESLTIVSPSDTDNGAHDPASNVRIFGLPSLLKLKALLDEVKEGA